MNKLYDKLLFFVGVFALLSGIAFYIWNFKEDSLADTLMGQSGSNQYQPILVPDLVEAYATWPNALEQAPGELYDVFTPPVIYVDKDGTFIFESPIEDMLPEPLGIYLAKIEREPYRIQLEGYVEEDLNDASKSLLLFYDLEKQKQVRVRVNDVVAASEFTVLNFVIDRIRSRDGNIRKLAVATLRDHRDARKLYLTHGERYYEENATVILRSKEDPAFEMKITEEPPVAFETSLAEYILEKINLEKSSVTVRRINSDGSQAGIEQLYPVPTNEALQKSPDTIESKVKQEPQTFEFQF